MLARPVVRRRAAAALLVATALLTALSGAALTAAWLDDRAIDARTGRATGEVVTDSATRTLVRFTTPEGAVYIPERGVFYPGGLETGQLVRVEYDTADPRLVRVQGRSALVGMVPALLAVGLLWALVLPAVWWLRRARVGPGEPTTT